MKPNEAEALKRDRLLIGRKPKYRFVRQVVFSMTGVVTVTVLECEGLRCPLSKEDLCGRSDWHGRSSSSYSI